MPLLVRYQPSLSQTNRRSCTEHAVKPERVVLAQPLLRLAGGTVRHEFAGGSKKQHTLARKTGQSSQIQIAVGRS